MDFQLGDRSVSTTPGYRSAVRRLEEFPENITIAMLASSQGWSRAKAGVYASNWRRRGLLESAGMGSGCYYNLIRSGSVDEVF